MTPKARRAVLVAAISVAVLCLLVGAAALWVLGTEAGARFAFERVGALIEGSLEVATLRGPIRGPLVLEGLVYRTSELTVTVERAELRWRLRRLLARQLDVTSLTASGVRVTSTPKETEEAREALPEVHLPVNVIVRSAEVTDVVFGPGSPDPLVVDRISLATRAVRDVVRIERLAVRSPRIDVDVAGTVRPQGEYPVNLTVGWSARLRDERWSGRGTFTGSLDRLVVRHDLAAPFSARLSATLTRPLRDLAFDGSIETPGVDLATIGASLPKARIAGRVSVRGTVERLVASGNLDARLAQGPVRAARAAFRVQRSGETWRVAEARVQVPGNPARISLAGSIVEADPLRVDLAAQWRDLAWPLEGGAAARSARGSLRVAGRLDDYGVEVSADLQTPPLPAGSVRVQGRGSRKELRLATLSAEILGGSLESSGRIAWSPSVSWDLELRAEGLDPGVLRREWPGSIDLTARTSGRLEPRLAAEARIGKLAGNLRGYPVSGEAAVTARGDAYTIERFSLAVARARVDVRGEAGRRLDLAYSIDAPDLAELLPESAGSLRARGNVAGRREAPRVSAALEGRSLLWRDVTVDELEGSADVGLDARGPLRADLSATGVEARGRSFQRVSLEARGTRASHDLLVTVDGERSDLLLAARGGLSGGSWSGTISRLDLDSRQIGAWRLERPAEVSAGASAGRIEGFCWSSAGGRLCADAAWGERRATLEATVAKLPLDLAEPWLPGRVDLTGRLDGSVDAERRPDGRLEAAASFTADGAAVAWETEEGAEVERRFAKASFEARAGSSGANASLVLALEGGGSIDGFLALPRYGDPNLPVRSQPLSGRLSADVADVGFLQALLPAVDRLSGAFRADLSVAGTPAAPRFSGRAALAGVRARLGRLGITVTGVELAAKGDGRGPLLLEGKMSSGGGTLTIAGRMPLDSNERLELSLRGRRFEAMDTPEARVVVSPDVRLVVTGDLASLTGEVVVPEAVINYKRTLAPIAPSPDVVYVGSEPEEKTPAPARATSARLRVVLGDDVIFRGLGLESRVEGSLLVAQQPGRDPTATGELVLAEGRYRKYGQNLTIERGRLVFAGPLDEPYVSLRASRRADDGTVAGIEIEGPLERPRASLFSDPRMRESDQLAYVVLGRPLDEASEEDRDLVTSAGTSLGVGGANLLARRLGSKVGLEVAKIETEGSFEDAALVLGKYLTPKMYVQYGVGFFDAVSTLRIEYVLSKKWTVRAEVGEGTSADVLYTIER